MTEKKIKKGVSRRAFLGRAAAVGATFVAGSASAQTNTQSTIDSIINARGRGTWDDQFDAQASRNAEKITSSVPILSPFTVA